MHEQRAGVAGKKGRETCLRTARGVSQPITSVRSQNALPYALSFPCVYPQSHLRENTRKELSLLRCQTGWLESRPDAFNLSLPDERLCSCVPGRCQCPNRALRHVRKYTAADQRCLRILSLYCHPMLPRPLQRPSQPFARHGEVAAGKSMHLRANDSPVVSQDLVRPVASHVVEALTGINQRHVWLLGIGHDEGMPEARQHLRQL